MRIEIAKKDFLLAVEKLKKKKPLGKGSKSFLSGMVGLSLMNDMAVFRIGIAYSTCAASGLWEGEVEFPFQIVMALVKVQPKTDSIIIHFNGHEIQVGPLKVLASLKQA